MLMKQRQLAVAFVRKPLGNNRYNTARQRQRRPNVSILSFSVAVYGVSCITRVLVQFLG